jgi:cell growth-regulating nucleolar protein
MTEAEKYEKTVYKGPKANKRKSVSILEPTDQNALVHQAKQPYVEDCPGHDDPPHVPTPPPAVKENSRDSVFDYMVEEDQPNTPKIAFAKGKNGDGKEMAMKNGAPPLFNESRSSSRNGYHDEEERLHSDEYAQNGFSYGAGAINPRASQDVNGSLLSLDFMTPAAKATRLKLEGKSAITPGHSRTNSGSEKKRKRGQSAPDVEGDTPMADVDTQLARASDTPGIAHSGLTGNLQRMVTDDSGFYPVHSDSEHETRERRPTDDRRKSRHVTEPASPLKRSRHSKEGNEKDESGLGISIKGRAVKALSMVGGALLPSAAQELQSAKTRRRASSSDHYSQSRPRDVSGEKRERKKHKVHRHNGTSSSNTRPEHRSRRRGSDESPEGGRHRMKAIEYHKHDDSGSDSDDGARNGTGQVVVFGEEDRQRKRCDTFLANIPKAGESEKGYSIHKALKRWHKQADHRGSEKSSEEDELWRALRLKMNDRGEVVVVFGGGTAGD